jgi:hypothetical protein
VLRAEQGQQCVDLGLLCSAAGDLGESALWALSMAWRVSLILVRSDWDSIIPETSSEARRILVPELSRSMLRALASFAERRPRNVERLLVQSGVWGDTRTVDTIFHRR